MNLWTLSRLSQLPLVLRRKIRFYAPLLESLDFMGVDPVTFSRASASSALWRDGASHAVAAHVPRFEFYEGLPLGLFIETGETLEFNPANNLHDENTVIWFEDAVPKSTPTNPVPFNSVGRWIGNLGVHNKHIVKASAILTNADINRIQLLFEDVAQEIVDPSPIIPAVGQFVYDNFPAQTRNGVNTSFTLQFEPVVESLLIIAHGGAPERVASSPQEMEYALSGVDNRNVTMGLGPTILQPFFAQYVRAA